MKHPEAYQICPKLLALGSILCLLLLRWQQSLLLEELSSNLCDRLMIYVHLRIKRGDRLGCELGRQRIQHPCNVGCLLQEVIAHNRGGVIDREEALIVIKQDKVVS